MRFENLREIGLLAYVAGLWLAPAGAQAQELLVDQASGTLEEPMVTAERIPENQIAQSFTPSLSAVGFIQLPTLVLSDPGGGIVILLNLRDGSFNGPIVSSTDPVIAMNRFTKVETFYFPGNIAVTPGQLYFFEPVLQSSGDMAIVDKSPSSYDRGELWINGGMASGGDLWFREGIVVPEPGTGVLVLIGLFLLFGWSRRRNRS